MSNIISLITDKNDKAACDSARAIAAESALSPDNYRYFEDFASLLTDSKSYIRTRAFILCCSQARWDNEGKIKKHLGSMLRLFHDEKPTVVRQSLNAIKEVVLYRPELCPEIKAELKNIDLTKYRDSMVPLIRKDIEEVLNMMNT